MTARVLAVLVWIGISVIPSIAQEKLDVVVGYLEQVVPAPPVLSNLDPIPEDQGLAGAKLGLADNNTTGKFLGQTYSLEGRVVQEDGDFLAAARELLGLTKTIVVNAPMEKLQEIAKLPEAKGAILFNASAADNQLRDDQCRANVFHTIPSRAMLADALAQFAVRKKWTKWVMIEGSRESDQAFARALERSAQKFQLNLLGKKTWAFDADMRRNAAAELPLFTQDFPEHDLLVVADEADDFARYMPYHTWIPRPIAGSEGLRPAAWSAAVEQHGAAQLQSRFRKLAKRAMRSIDYSSWIAVRAIGEVVTRTKSADPATLRSFMLSEKFDLAGFKGRKLTFRSWNGQLRQPIPLSHARAVVALAPIEGFLHQRNELDTLGLDEPESACTAFKE